jgi:NitT/TauT family transport system permease protein
MTVATVSRRIAGLSLWDRGGRWMVPVIGLALWQIAYAGVGEPGLASPAASVRAIFDDLDAWLPDLGVTLWTLAVSFVISAIVGVLVGFLLGLSRFWYSVSEPLLIIAYSLPKIVLYPIVLTALGLTPQARIVFSALHGVFPIMLMTATATANVPEIRTRVARAYGLGFSRRLRMVVLPSIASTVVASLRIGFGACFLGLVLAEMFAAYNGLGFRLSKYISTSNTPPLLGVVLLITGIAFVVTFAIYHWEERRNVRLTGQRPDAS